VRVLLAQIIILAIAFIIVDAIMDTVTVSGGFFSAVGLAVIYGLVSGVIGKLLRLLTLPLVIITIGLFQFVINAALLLITDWLTDWLEVESFLSALAASVVLAIVSTLVALVASIVLPDTSRS